MIRWKKTSEHSIASTCGRFHIARLFKDGVPGYLLWDRNEIVPGCSEDADKRKQDAEAILRGEK